MNLNPDFLIIPFEIIADKDVDAVGEKLYGLIYWYTKLKLERCIASNATFGQILGIGDSGIRKGLDQLEKKGYIQRVYKDAQKRNRTEIIALVTYQKMPATPPQLLRDATTVASNDATTVAQSSNILKRKGNKRLRAPRAQPPKAPKKSKKEYFLDPRPMNLSEFLAWCRKSKDKHIHVIAEWAEAEKPDYTTRGQWHAFISRNVRAAMPLTAFTMEQLQKAYDKLRGDLMKKDPATGKTVGFITKYTLETLAKYI